jgi:hypothetical protein
VKRNPRSRGGSPGGLPIWGALRLYFIDTCHLTPRNYLCKYIQCFENSKKKIPGFIEDKLTLMIKDTKRYSLSAGI